MGKASEWIRNFLIGKREDKVKKTSSSIPAENTHKVKRRWSFKRSTSTKSAIMTHKSTKSFDSILIPKQCSIQYETPQNHAMARLNPHAAAIKIQAAYRSYLARRALCALRGLVKLQAVARGYLVRKQMNAVVRSMRALMVIQVRARIHRVQMADEPTITGPRKSCRESSAFSERQLRKETSDNIVNEIINQSGECLRSQSGRKDTIPSERVQYGSSRCNSARLSVSQREYQLKAYPTPSTSSSTDSISTTYDWQQEFSPKVSLTNSKPHSACPEQKQLCTNPSAQYPIFAMSNSEFLPSYMTNTRSSKAKSRSYSQPRERPNLGRKQNSRRSSSMDGKNEKGNMYPWLITLYQSSKFMNDEHCDSSVSAVSHRKSLIPFEVRPGQLDKRIKIVEPVKRYRHLLQQFEDGGKRDQFPKYRYLLQQFKDEGKRF